MRNIVESQSHVAMSVDSINMALKEQASATREMAGRVESVSHGAQALPVTVERTETNARELVSKAQSLDKLAAKFKL
ncbi:hypothetical protein ACQE3D_13425 [Methylomonas sp. MS20]|uniref:hypothetical protein n=1 Tax=unclassified Methylomonas TaxID=2608980 RepID=UPI0028A30266|nr:hypothetical protein [Methylomonas sp. MV1]MDT4331632.1 hypothetical protein [Methylomonas sp. MV1]